jgi:hypothetical protein
MTELPTSQTGGVRGVQLAELPGAALPSVMRKVIEHAGVR